MLGSISGHREEAASTRAPFGLLQLRLDSVPSFTASFRPFSNVPLTFWDGLKAARKRRLSRPTYSLPLSLFLSASVAHSSLECSSLRERTWVWLITWSSDICADRKLRTGELYGSVEEPAEDLASLFPYNLRPFHLTLGVTMPMCFSNLASSHQLKWISRSICRRTFR